MADAFSQFDAISLLVGKHVLFIGDSNTRAHYKDLLWLLSSNTLMSNASLRAKCELSALGEKLLKRSEFSQTRDFKEHRIINFDNTGTKLEFIFITRCYNHQVEDVFNRIGSNTKPCPDIIVMNSCVWDLTRWGPKGVPKYKDNMVQLLRLMKRSLPLQCLVIWTTALPPAAHVRGGLIIKQVACMEPLLRFEVMEANTFARDVVANHGFDVVDLHYHTRMQMHRRSRDGIHFMPTAVRLMTNLLLTHVALTWDCELPNNINSVLLDKAIDQAMKNSRTAVKSVVTVPVPNNSIFSKINLKSPVVPKHRGLKVTFNAKEGKTSRNCHLNVMENNSIEMNQLLLSPRSLTISVEAQQHCRRTLEFQDQSEYGPYRKRSKNRNRNKNKKRTDPYDYQQKQRYNMY